ncbi:MAG: hypothetical protein ACO3RX_03585 [Chthoniobacterales bacterium]
MKAVIGAVLARCPRASAGHTCAVMNWVKGLESLGWEVWITEHLTSDELEAPEAGRARSPQEEFWHETAAEFGLSDRQCLIIDGQSPDLEAFRDFCAGADLFLNYSGQFKRLDLLGDRITKAYLDVDPGFTQLWVETCGTDMNFAGHDLFLTVGSNFRSPNLRLPRTSQEWIPLVAPVPGDYWRGRLAAAGGADDHNAWTTVSHWYGYNDLVWEGKTYGGKRDSLHALANLPRMTGVPFAIASDLQPGWEDYDPFVDGGWKLISSADVCRDVDSYLRFIAGSRGEIGVAKGGYVVSRGGWISDRSVIYLALGRPVVLQDTGWPEVVTPRPGLLPFEDVFGAAKRIEEAENNLEAQSTGARKLADEVFAPASALKPLLERVS